MSLYNISFTLQCNRGCKQVPAPGAALVHCCVLVGGTCRRTLARGDTRPLVTALNNCIRFVTCFAGTLRIQTTKQNVSLLLHIIANYEALCAAIQNIQNVYLFSFVTLKTHCFDKNIILSVHVINIFLLFFSSTFFRFLLIRSLFLLTTIPAFVGSF